MAEDTASKQGDTNESHERRECMPCGGSGQVISKLGGAPSKVNCPWCGGTGVRNTQADAQASWRAQEAGGSPDERSPGAAAGSDADPGGQAVDGGSGTRSDSASGSDTAA